MKTIRTTRSVCPKCLQNLPAVLQEEDGSIYITRSCPEHGLFREIVWRGKADFRHWTQYAPPLTDAKGTDCPGSCGICREHESGSCCVLLEVTSRCNLSCRFCFANGGTSLPDPSMEEMKAAISQIVQQRGPVLLQLSGGEPTLREDLPQLIRHAKEAGCSYVQLNTNGIRLAREPEYARSLRDAGLDIVFLQFDGIDDTVYETLRGRQLLDIKREAIAVCDQLCLGVTLVPTVVKGVNDHQLGDLIHFAQAHMGTIRGIHFQPVSYFGRHPGAPSSALRYTLDQLMADISAQAQIPMDAFMPSRCDHPLCGFHLTLLPGPGNTWKPMTNIKNSSPTRGTSRDNREYVAAHWQRPKAEPAPHGLENEEMDFDTFLYRVRHQSLALSAMAFQDAGNLNIERLHRCTLHVFANGTVKPFCAHYLTPME